METVLYICYKCKSPVKLSQKDIVLCTKCGSKMVLKTRTKHKTEFYCR